MPAKKTGALKRNTAKSIETKAREDICRFGRSLFERGFLRQYQRQA